MMDNFFDIDYSRKEVHLMFRNQYFKIDLTQGDLEDSWNTIFDDGVPMDFNFKQEDENDEPSVSIYPLHYDPVDETFDVLIDEGISIPARNKYGAETKYFNRYEQ